MKKKVITVAMIPVAIAIGTIALVRRVLRRGKPPPGYHHEYVPSYEDTILVKDKTQDEPSEEPEMINGVRVLHVTPEPVTGKPPERPVIKSAIAGENESTISWDPAKGASRYVVVRDNRIIARTDELVFHDTTLVSGRPHHYHLEAVNEFGTSEPSEEVVLIPQTRTPSSEEAEMPDETIKPDAGPSNYNEILADYTSSQISYDQALEELREYHNWIIHHGTPREKESAGVDYITAHSRLVEIHTQRSAREIMQQLQNDLDRLQIRRDSRREREIAEAMSVPAGNSLAARIERFVRKWW